VKEIKENDFHNLSIAGLMLAFSAPIISLKSSQETLMNDDCVFPYFEELPSMPKMMRELSLPGDGQKPETVWPMAKEIVQTSYLMLVFFIVAALFWCVFKFHWELWGANALIHDYAKVVLLILILCAQLQLLFRVVAGIRSLFHLSIYSANETQRQFDQERILIRRLSHIAPNLLQQCRKRADMEIDILKQVSLVAVLLSAIVALGQLHFGPVPVIQGAVLGIILLVACFMYLIRQYSRLVFVLNCAESLYASACCTTR
jgi:membrane protein YdbS with pleckstrin-like domain